LALPRPGGLHLALSPRRFSFFSSPRSLWAASHRGLARPAFSPCPARGGPLMGLPLALRHCRFGHTFKADRPRKKRREGPLLGWPSPLGLTPPPGVALSFFKVEQGRLLQEPGRPLLARPQALVAYVLQRFRRPAGRPVGAPCAPGKGQATPHPAGTPQPKPRRGCRFLFIVHTARPIRPFPKLTRPRAKTTDFYL